MTGTFDPDRGRRLRRWPWIEWQVVACLHRVDSRYAETYWTELWHPEQGTGYVRDGDDREVLYDRPGGTARKVRLPV